MNARVDPALLRAVELPEPRPLHTLFGAALDGVDLAEPVTAREALGLRRLLERFLLLVLPGQAISAAGVLDLAERIAGAAAAPAAPPEPGEGPWAADRAEWAVPPIGAVLHAPATGASAAAALGETWFASQLAAYDRVPGALRRRVEYLEAEHRAQARGVDRAEARGGSAAAAGGAAELGGDGGAAQHPVVRMHLVAGRRGLFVNPATTTRLLGVSEPDSARLLAELQEVAARPDVTFRHLWQPGDLVLWDSRALQHRHVGWPAGASVVGARFGAERPVGAALVDMPWVVAG